MFEVIKGQLNDVETQALTGALNDIAVAAEEARNTKPHTRGWWGLPSRTDNPTGFRNASLPAQ